MMCSDLILHPGSKRRPPSGSGPRACRWGQPLLAFLIVTLLSMPDGRAESVPKPDRKPEIADTSDAGFVSWINQFRKYALQKGISPATFDLAFAGISIKQSVLTASERQPEVEQRIWTYLEKAVSSYRLQRGRELMATHQPLLQEIYETYGVQPHVLVAIWGLESNFGAAMGKTDTFEALATIAYQGRRRAFARKELIAALTILEKGYAKRDQLRGSWAGAMGQTQFIPSTYLNYAVDGNGDGRRDLWHDLEDVFASTANYLAKWNWQRGRRWGREVITPADFDYTLADPAIIKPVESWSKLGVRAAATSLEADKNQAASLFLPAGHAGPAFLIYQNFRSIMKYNNSPAYALAVSHLADRLDGAAPLKGKWPKSEPPLTRHDRIDMQRRLKKLGYELGRTDGIVGARTRAALRLYQKKIGLPADGFPTSTILARLRQDKEAGP